MTARGLAVTLAVGMATSFAVGEVVLRSAGSGSGWSETDPWPVTLGFNAMVLAYLLVGAVVVSRLPWNPVGWLFITAGFWVGLTSVTWAYATFATAEPGGLPGGVVAAWVTSWSWEPAVLAVPALLFLLFPDGGPPTRRWRWVVPLVVVGLAFALAGTAFARGAMTGSALPRTANPFGFADPGTAAVLVGVGMTACLVGLVLAVCSFVLRFRRSRGERRQQLKWFAWSPVLVPVFLASEVVVDTFGDPAVVPYMDLAFALCLTAVPLAAGTAILRYRLYDIDLVIKRTLVYGSLTATLVATYLLLVLALRLLVDPLTGESDLAVGVSTLAVAALFRPVRARIQAVVDRRFFRSRYDAVRTVEGFAGRLRDELDLESLGADLRGVVRDTMQPVHVSLWLRSAP